MARKTSSSTGTARGKKAAKKPTRRSVGKTSDGASSTGKKSVTEGAPGSAARAAGKKSAGGRAAAQPIASRVTLGARSRAAGDVAGRDIVKVVQRVVKNTEEKSAASDSALPPEVAAYVTWLRGQPTGLNLIGVAGGDMQLALDEVYVPLSLAHGRVGLHAERRSKEQPELLDAGHNTFGLPDLFARVPAHAILLGGAGTGKTTALRKLVQLCLPSPPRARGKRAVVVTGPATIHLASGYVPIFVPLRRFTRADMGRTLADFLHDELARAAKDRPKMARAVLGHPHLLVLLDGLDEIADPELRADFCAHLGQQLRRNEYSGWRVVVTSRPAGYGGGRCRLGDDQFTEVALQPLGREQVPQLVDRWFQEAARKLEGYPQERATRDAEELKQALTRPDFGQRMEVMFATPLLLTLLCVVVQRGKEMPRSRAKFYDECLRVLLERWHAAKDRDGETTSTRAAKKLDAAKVEAHPGFLDAEVAIDLLRPIAYELHRQEKRDEATADELAVQIHARLQKLQRREKHRDVLRWLRERAAVIVDFGENPVRLGFFHLHIQEYLAALHVEREGLLAELAGQFGREWWHEVARLVVSIGGKRTFSGLLDLLLTEEHLLDEKRHGVLRDMFVDAREVDLEPVWTRLERDELPAPDVLLALMRLVQGMRDAQLAASARRLASRTRGAVQTAAEHLAATAAPIASGSDGKSIAVLAHSVDAEDGNVLAAHLRRIGVSIWPGSGAMPTFESFDGERLEQEVSAAALVLGSQAWWTAAPMRARLQLLQLAGVRLVGVRPPGACSPREVLPVDVEVDCSGGWTDATLSALRRLLVPRPGGPVEGQAFVEPLTGVRLVWVPGGSFVMGSDKLGGSASPEHPVRVSPFWLGETPVTNRQYEIFVKETGHRRPRSWSDPKFSDPDQPVVFVSWNDAMAFCAWLSERSGLQVTLPSEAEWEFAARGTDGRMYPWGNDPPEGWRACYAQDAPARVGSYPNGLGPFGALDQAGNVWEWCLDMWHEEVYAERAKDETESVDPVVNKGDEKFRPLRGGCWAESSKNAEVRLAAAFRLRHWHFNDDFDDFGFRVLVAPASRPARS